MFCSSSSSPIIAWIEKALPVGARRFISGKLELWDGHLQMVHPDRVVDAEGLAQMPLVEPVYGLTEGLAPRALAKIIGAALARLPKLPDWWPKPAPSRPICRASPRRSRPCITRPTPRPSPPAAGAAAPGLRRIAGASIGARR